ncbi:DUF305 domain-containing protein [soil metagenome]
MSTRMQRLSFLLAAVVVAALALAGCGGGPTSDRTGQEGTSGAGFNDADVTFLQGMTAHHEEAVEMAELVPGRAAHPELMTFADQIIATQTAEIDQMMGLLEEAGEDAGAGHGGMDMEGMPGMSAQQMAELEQLEGQQFDLTFLEMMTVHHMGANEMSRMVIDQGRNPVIQELAETIISAQTAEIHQMRRWQRQWMAA